MKVIFPEKNQTETFLSANTMSLRTCCDKLVRELVVEFKKNLSSFTKAKLPIHVKRANAFIKILHSGKREPGIRWP